MLRFTMIIQMNFSALKLIVGVFVIAWHKQEFFFVVGMATYKRLYKFSSFKIGWVYCISGERVPFVLFIRFMHFHCLLLGAGG